MECIACGGNQFSLWGCKDGYKILKCAGCGLGATWPRPSPDKLEEFNRGIYSPREREVAYESRKAELDRRYAAVLARIRRFAPSGSLLDAGCNIGLFLRAAREAGFDVHGTEINAVCAEYGRGKFALDIRAASLSDAGFGPGSFDVVTMFDVLEHVPDPRDFLGDARRLLKPGGLLVLQAPNLASVMAWLMGENWNWLTPPDHLYHFTPGALLRLLEAAGFAAADVRTWEPARDFTGNIYSGFPAAGAAGRALRKLLWLASIPAVPLLQRLWWKAGAGGLVEIYSRRVG